MTKFQRRKIDNVPPLVQYKWSSKVTEEGFVPFPKRLLRCLSQIFGAGATIEHLQVVLAVVDYNRPNLLHPPSLGYLAFTAGLEEGVFRQRLKELESAGLVEVQDYGGDVLMVTIKGLLGQVVNLTPDERAEDEQGGAEG